MNSTPIANPTPKAKFQESNDNISKHRAMVDSREFERAQDVGLLEHTAAIALTFNPTSQVEAIAAAFRIRGALEYAMQMRMLAEKPLPPRPVTPVGNLDHNLS